MKDLPVFKSPRARAAVMAEYEAILARWPAASESAAGGGAAPVERLRIPTTAGETAVLAFGPRSSPKPPLLLLHGAGTNSSMWIGDAALFARERRVFALDIPGEPGMSEDRKLEWSLEACGAWLGETTAALGLREHALLGLSLGGWMGLAYAISRAKNQVAGGGALCALALLCPSGIGRTRPSFMFKAMLAMARGRRGLEALSRSLYGDLPPSEEAILVGTLLAESTRARMEAPRLFSDEELAGIAVPLFLGVGAKDSLLRSKESAERLARLRPDAEIILDPRAGHALVGLGEKVADFLTRRA
jgi:pimeloyl-ACP methyl ester carboxylesterase